MNNDCDETNESSVNMVSSPQPNPGKPIRAICQSLRASLVYVDDSREKSLAITKLDEFELCIGKALYGRKEVRIMGNIEVHRYPEGCGHVMEDGSIKREWDGYIQPEDKSWIAFVNMDGQATFFLEREPSGAVVMR